MQASDKGGTAGEAQLPGPVSIAWRSCCMVLHIEPCCLLATPAVTGSQASPPHFVTDSFHCHVSLAMLTCQQHRHMTHAQPLAS